MSSKQLPEGDVLLSQAIEAINSIVLNLSMEDAHYYISIVREHLDARFEQTRPLEDDFSDLLGA